MLAKRGFLAASIICLAVVVMLPLLVIVSNVLFGSWDVWQHLAETVLWDYISNSLALAFGVSLGVLIIAVPSAWLVSLYDFPLRRYFVWALLLPLAMPAYIIAYTYTGMLDATGPVQTLIRDVTGWGYHDYWFFEIRSLTGAMLMLTLVLYPYVYLLARSAFVGQSASILEVSQNLGYNRWYSLFFVALPMARPAIMTGLSLALMETLADFGTVSYFGISTFTTGIFRAFESFGDLAAASQLAGLLLIFVALLIFAERYSRHQSRYFEKRGKTNRRIALTGAQRWLATMYCALPLLFGFLIPVLQLAYWAIFIAERDAGFLELAWHSFYLASLAAFIAVVCGALLAYAKRILKRPIYPGLFNVATLGYALPGTIIAIGVLIPLAWLDHQLIDLAERWFGWNIGLILSGTLFALLFAYLVRFLTISMGTIDSGLQRISPSIDDAGSLMGYPPLQIFTKIHLPILRGSFLTAFLIVFVDVLKELPATLLLRPFDYNTLAVKAYEYASDERLIDAAPASLLIVLVGLAPVILLSYSINRSAFYEKSKRHIS